MKARETPCTGEIPEVARRFALPPTLRHYVARVSVSLFGVSRGHFKKLHQHSGNPVNLYE